MLPSYVAITFIRLYMILYRHYLVLGYLVSPIRIRICIYVYVAASVLLSGFCHALWYILNSVCIIWLPIVQ